MIVCLGRVIKMGCGGCEYSIIRSNQVHRVGGLVGLRLFLLEVAVDVVLRRVLSGESGRFYGI